MRTVLAVSAVLLVLLPHAVQAHSAAAPRAQDTRLVHDHNDDCGGDGVTSNCRGTIDLIALDVQEFWDGAVKVNFRFTLDKGQSGSHKLTLTYEAPSGKKSFEVSTTDQTTFTGGFDKLAVSSANDGTRFTLEGTMTSEKAGLAPNAKLSNFRVEARRDGTLGDFMPGGYQGPLGAVQDPAQGDGPTNYVRPEYQRRGTEYYVALSGPEATGEGTTATVTLEVINALDAAQTAKVTLSSDVGKATFAGGGTEKTVDIARKGSATFDVEVEGAATGKIFITVTTNLGGKLDRDRGFTITPSGGSDPTGDPSGEIPVDEPSKGAPLPPMGLLAIAILAAIAWRRR